MSWPVMDDTHAARQYSHTFWATLQAFGSESRRWLHREFLSRVCFAVLSICEIAPPERPRPSLTFHHARCVSVSVHYAFGPHVTAHTHTLCRPRAVFTNPATNHLTTHGHVASYLATSHVRVSINRSFDCGC